MPTERDYMRAAYAARQRGDEEAVAYFRSKYVKDEQYDPTEGMSGKDKFLAGVGSGMVDAGRNITKMLLPKHLEPEWVSDEAIREQRQLDAPLMETGAGLAGNIVGGAVATAPVGGAVGAGVRGLGLAAQGARALPRAAQVAGRVAGGRAVPITTQGAVEGAILAGPDQRLSGAAMGAGSAGVMHGAGRLFKRSLNKRATNKAPGEGKVRISDEAKSLLGQSTKDDLGNTVPPLMDVGFIPISQAAPRESLTRQAYEGLVANIPWGGQKIRSQLKTAQAAFRENALKEAVPSGVPAGTIIDVGDSIQGSMARLEDAWSTAFDEIKAMAYQVPKKFKVSDDVARTIGKESKGGIKIPAAGEVVDGETLLDLRQAAQEIIDGLKNTKLDKSTRRSMRDLQKNIDKIIEENLDPNGWVAKGRKRLPDGPRILKEYQENLGKWRNWQVIQSAAGKKSATSEFSPQQLATAASQNVGRKGLQGKGGTLQKMGQAGMTALEEFPSRQGIFQTVAAMGAIPMASGIAGGYFGGLEGAIAAPAMVIGGARVAAMPSVQRALMGKGRTAGKRAVALKKALEAKGRTGLSRGQAYGFGGRQLGVSATSPDEEY